MEASEFIALFMFAVVDFTTIYERYVTGLIF